MDSFLRAITQRRDAYYLDSFALKKIINSLEITIICPIPVCCIFLTFFLGSQKKMLGVFNLVLYLQVTVSLF